MKEKEKKNEKINSSGWIGRQLSRLKMGQSYYIIVIQTITMISILTLAFAIGIHFAIILFFLFIFGALILGYYLDKKNINSREHLDMVNRQNRYYNYSNAKNQQFEMIKTKIFIKSIEKMTNAILEALDKNPISFDDEIKEFEEKYRNYYIKWKAPP
ncbi:MAG: hypothetical protein ACFFDN_00540 [Candidatus Hodarchaeota archaeon]